MDRAQQRVGLLERRELEYGFCRRRLRPAGEWPSPPYTKVARTPIVREKPFLAVDEQGNYYVRVPELRVDSTGISWRGGSTPGRSIPLSRFYIAHPGDTAAQINAQLARGKNLLFTPGIYDLTETLRVTRPNTVVMGLGFATLRPVTGKAALTTADADGIILAGLLFDAGALPSPVLLEIGVEGSRASHSGNPISLHDIFFRVGGAGAGRADVNLEINSNGTIVDHTWIWRADHGSGVGWQLNRSNNGLVVNGDNVTAYGLFVEHHQQFQVLWKGNGGRTVLLSIRDPLRSPGPGQLCQRAGSERLGLLQGSRKRDKPRSLGPGHLLGLPARQCGARPRHRDAPQSRHPFPSHGHGRA